MSNLLTTLHNSAHLLTVVLSKQEEATKALEGQLPRMMQINKKKCTDVFEGHLYD